MAISASTQMNVRDDGVDTNGGGFVAGASGTDYSLQAAANSGGNNSSTTDVVANGTTTLTSAGASFTSAIVGNIIYLTGGTGPLAATRRQVTVFTNSTTITVDATVASGTGITMNVGGAFLTVGAAVTACVSGNIVNVKTGTYTITAVIAMTVTTLTVKGYGTTPGDGGTAPLITTATDSTPIFNSNSSAGGFKSFNNLSLSNTASTRSSGIVQITTSGSSQWWAISNCSFDGFTWAVNARNAAGDFPVARISLTNCLVKNSSTLGIEADSSGAHSVWVSGCTFSTNAADINTGTNGTTTVMDSILEGTTGASVTITGPVAIVQHNSFEGTGGNALVVSNSVTVIARFQNNIFYGCNRAIGITAGGANVQPWLSASRCNAFGNNTNANTGWGTSTGDVTLTADPFTNSGAGDYSLNTTSGGGAACRQVGFPGAFPGGTSTGYPDIGAVQAQVTASSSGIIVHPGMVGGIHG